MELSRIHYEGLANVPATATKVKVTHVLNPYMMTVVLLNDDRQNVNAINTKLRLTMRQKKLTLQNNSVPAKPGDAVIGSDLEGLDGNMPCYLYRGLVEDVNTSTNSYNVFLTDCGNAVELARDQFIVVPHDFIPNAHLTTTIGLYNIVPSITTKNTFSKFKCNSLISDSWCGVAVQFVKEFLIASTATYFNCLAVDESGQKYGDLYLDIDNNIVSLCRSLVFNHYADYLEDLHYLIEHPNKQYHTQLDDNRIIFLSHSNSLHIKKDSKNFENPVHGKPGATDKVIASTEYDNLLPKFEAQNDGHNMLIYSRVTYKPINNVADAKFPAGIHAAWDMYVKSSRPQRMQSYIWPAIKKFSNVVAIGVADSGKTYGYIAAVSALLATHKTLPQGTKPSALVLCSSTSQTLSIQYFFTQFLQNYDAVKAVAGFNGKSDRSFVAEVYNGCQVLVTTPRYLTRFLNRNKRIFNFEWLRFLILDHADVILNKYFDAIGELFTKYKIIANRERQYNDTPPLQTIMVARRWTPSLKKTAFALMDDPCVCIGSFIEACVFKSIRPTLLVTNSENKQKKVLDVLTERPSSRWKSMVICTNAKEAEDLNTFLSLRNTYLAHENMSILDLQFEVERFKEARSNNPIFICTDEVLAELNITDIDYLIHYSVLMDLQTQFNFRFSTLLQNLRKEEPCCKVFVFIDENNAQQFHSIVRTIQRMKVPIPSNILNHVKRISAMLDRNKTDVRICDNVKSLGFCVDKNSCLFRHCILPDVDKPITPIKIGDKVKLMILFTHNATHFSVRITEYTRIIDNEPTTFKLCSADYIELSIKIQKFYSDRNNRRKCATVNVGDICVLEDSIDNFTRVQILYFEPEISNCYGNSKVVCVRCMDTGIILEHVSENRLLWIPDELLKLRSHVTEMFLTGIAPYDEECDWSSFANGAVHNWFSENFHDGCYVLGEVRLHLGDTIWVETLEIGTELLGYPDLIGCSLKAELIEKEHAILNEQHLDRLRDIYVDPKVTQDQQSNNKS